MKFTAEDISEQYLSLSREQVARALGICVETLDALHDRGQGPPRFRASPRRWAYPASEFKRWQQQRAEQSTPLDAA